MECELCVYNKTKCCLPPTRIKERCGRYAAEFKRGNYVNYHQCLENVLSLILKRKIIIILVINPCHVLVVIIYRASEWTSQRQTGSRHMDENRDKA